MIGRDIGGSYITPLSYRLGVQQRRNLLRAAGRCINGPLVGYVGRHGVEHGDVVKSGKCQRCLDVYEKTSG